MTIENSETIDYLSTPEEGGATLIVHDNLAWHSDHDRHLFLMWRKLSHYAHCLSSPNVCQSLGIDEPTEAVVLYGATHALSADGAAFLEEARHLFQKGVQLRLKMVTSPVAAASEGR